MIDNSKVSLELYRRQTGQGANVVSYSVHCYLSADGGLRIDENSLYPDDENGRDVDRECTIEFTPDDTLSLVLLLLRASFGGETLTFKRIEQLARDNNIACKRFLWSHGGA